MAKILLVDDQQEFCDLLARKLQRLGHNCTPCYEGKEAVRLAANNLFDAALLDYNLSPGDLNGMQILKAIRKRSPDTSVMMMTGQDDINLAVQCIKNGAEEYFLKTPNLDDLIEDLLLAVQKAEKEKGLRYELEYHRSSSSSELIGNSQHMKKITEVISLANRGTNPDVTVLITGETGTGKDLIANHIHKESKRAEEPFIPVNCSSIAKSLIESEFFGHEKGAFTGADRAHRGVFERANKGTVFLDEIGDMDFELQSSLLRLLENHTLTRVGGSEEIAIDVRVICATHKDLAKEVEAGNFREDLFFRINVLNITIPPLRERPEDIIPLAEHFIRSLSKQTKPPVISAAMKQQLLNYYWKGNVRELRNVIERELVLYSGSGELDLQLSELPAVDAGSGPLPAERSGSGPSLQINLSQPLSLEQIEKEVITKVLKTCQFNISEAARHLQMHRSSLRSKIKRYNIDI